MAALLAHEYLHSGPDTETHDHDGEFYERFHNAVIDTDLIGRAADSMLAYMASIARKDGRSPSKAILKFEDLHEALERVGGKPNGPLISESEAAEMKALAALESDSQIDDDEDKAQAA